jgi:hypothetical protein
MLNIYLEYCFPTLFSSGPFTGEFDQMDALNWGVPLVREVVEIISLPIPNVVKNPRLHFYFNGNTAKGSIFYVDQKCLAKLTSLFSSLVNGVEICMMRVLLVLFDKEINGNADVAEHCRGCWVDRRLSKLGVVDRGRLAR